VKKGACTPSQSPDSAEQPFYQVFTIALLFQIIEAATGSMDKFATARQLIGLFCGIAIATGIGAVDDIRHLKARMKFPVNLQPQ